MPNPLLGSLADPFTATTINTAAWSATTGGGLVTIAAPGRIGIQATNAAPALGAAGPYDATGQALYARITPALAGTGGAVVTTTLKVQLNSSNYAALVCTPGTTWQAVVTTAGTPATTNLGTFDPAAYAWWQIAEAAGQFLFSVSPDGVAWTQVAAVAHPWAVTGVGVYISASSAVVVGQSAYVEHVNTLAGPLGPLPSWPKIMLAVAFNQGANASAVPSYVDLSQRLRGSWSAGLSGRQYELDQIQSGQLACTLANPDGALDPLNTLSPYYPNVVPMRGCRLTAAWPQTRNLMDYGFANGSSVNYNTALTAGSVSIVTGAGAPTGHDTAISWVIPAGGPPAGALGQGAAGNPAYRFTQAGPMATPLPGGSGGTWSASVWVTSFNAASVGLSALLQICWYDVTGARMSISTGSTVSTPAAGVWQQYTATAAAPAGAVSCRSEFVLSATTSVTTTLLLTAWQLEVAAAPTPWTSPGVTYPVWSGFVERWPQQWDYSGTYGLVDITAVDVLASLADFKLTSSLLASLLALGPTRLYPLDEPTGSTRFRDVTGLHLSATIASSSLGAGTLTAGNSITGSGSVGSAGPVVTLANPAPNASTSQAGTYLNLPSPVGPPTSGAWTRLICFRTTTVPTAGNTMFLWGASAPNFGAASCGLYIDSSQLVHAFATNSHNQTLSTYVPIVSVCDGNWHQAAIRLSSDGKEVDCVVDAFNYFNTDSVDHHPTGITWDTIGCNAVPGNQFYGSMFSGDIAYACEIPNAAPTLPDISAGFATGWAGETSAARAQRILSLSGYMGSLASVDATSPMGGAALAGLDAMSALQLVADTENGQVYADSSGTVQLVGRLWRYYQGAASILIGERPAGGEIPYLGDVAVDFDTTHIYNQVSVTNQGTPGAPQQPPATFPNATSAAAYAPRTLSRTINILDPNVPQVAAQYLAQQYGEPLARVEALTVDPAANPALWPQLLSLGFGSRVQLSRRPPSGAGAQPIVLQQFLEHLSWSGDDKGVFRAQMQLSSATPYLGWWIVSSLHSPLQAQATAGASTITLGPLTGSALNPAKAVLPKGTVLTVGYGTATAESVTVLSVAATSPGYTTVVITLTAPLASTHAAGQTVCQPLPGGYTLPPLPTAGYPVSLDAGATLSATGPRVTY